MNDDDFLRFKLKELTTPCSNCGRMPDQHGHCPCLVLGCCGYRINERCDFKTEFENNLPDDGYWMLNWSKALIQEPPREPAITWYEDKELVPAKETIWDKKSIIMFQGPQRTAQYSFELRENFVKTLIKKVLRGLRLMKEKESIVKDWKTYSIIKDMGALALTDEAQTVPPDFDIMEEHLKQAKRDLAILRTLPKDPLRWIRYHERKRMDIVEY